MSAAPTLAETGDPIACVNPWIARMPVGGMPKSIVDLARERDVARLHMLHLNECPVSPSPRVIEAVTRLVAGTNRYPQPRGHDLAAAIAARTGVPAGRIVFGTGSDEVLHFAAGACLAPGTSAVMPTPSFPRYRMSTALMGATPIMVKLDADGANDADALLAAIRPDTRILFVCTPNNPSGPYMPADRLRHLIADTPDHVLLAVDEAYYEFGRHAGAPDVLAALADRRGPWAVFRTFSKAYALAGMRVGYCLAGSEALAQCLRKLSTTFNVTDLAYAAALAAYEDEAHTKAILDGCARERARIADGLAALGYQPLPSAANFLSFDCHRPVDPVIAGIEAEGVLIREWRDPGYETFLRISIGGPASTDAVLAAIAKVLGPAAR
jgi:histidinol-phosphate aminotransferase